MCPPLRAAVPCIFAVLQKCQRALPCARPCGRLAVHFCCPAKMSAGTSVCPPLSFGRLRRAFLLSCKNVSGHLHVPAPAGGSAVHFCCPAKMSAGTSMCPPLRAAPPCIFAVLQKCQRAPPCARPFGRLRAAPPCIFAVLQKCQRAPPCARPCGRLRRAFLLSCKNVLICSQIQCLTALNLAAHPCAARETLLFRVSLVQRS